MPKRLFYKEGQESIRMGQYFFERGKPVAVPDDIADVLIRKGRVQEYEEEKPARRKDIE